MDLVPQLRLQRKEGSLATSLRYQLRGVCHLAGLQQGPVARPVPESQIRILPPVLCGFALSAFSLPLSRRPPSWGHRYRQPCLPVGVTEPVKCIHTRLACAKLVLT